MYMIIADNAAPCADLHCSISRRELGGNYVAFSMAPAQIGDASAGTDDFCPFVGPAAERHRAGAGFRAAGRPGPDRARGQGSAAANGDAGAVARRGPAADRRCGGALVSGTGQRDRRGCRGISRPWRPRGVGGAVRGAGGLRECPGGGAGRIYPPRVRERQARPHRGRRSRRSDPCRHRPATPPGAAPVERPARRQRARLARADHRGLGADRGRDRFLRRGRCAGRIDRAGAGEDQRPAGRNRRSPCGTGPK